MNWIDKIYIISLKSQIVRKANILADLDSAGFDTSKIEWIEAIKGIDLDIHQCINDGSISDVFLDPFGLLTKSIYGCSLSHQLAYKMLLESEDDVKTALILEDDAAITHTLLRMLLPNSIGYTKFIEDIDDIDWEVIMLGGQKTEMEHEDNNSVLLKKMVKYPTTYAAHAYAINKPGARKLLKNNECVRFAADVNIHMSDVNLYCTPISYFIQKMGNMKKELAHDLINDYAGFIKYSQNDWDPSDIESSTVYGDGTTSDGTNTKTVVISAKVDIDSVDWKPFQWNGGIVDGWTRIHLKV
jgi:GR25 family glycosyltransferase involved in LPS biosynthesis